MRFSKRPSAARSPLCHVSKSILITVDGRNPAPPEMYDTPSIMGYLPYQLVQDFFHQQYDSTLTCHITPSHNHHFDQAVVVVLMWLQQPYGRGCMCCGAWWAQCQWPAICCWANKRNESSKIASDWCIKKVESAHVDRHLGD